MPGTISGDEEQVSFAVAQSEGDRALDSAVHHTLLPPVTASQGAKNADPMTWPPEPLRSSPHALTDENLCLEDGGPSRAPQFVARGAQRPTSIGLSGHGNQKGKGCYDGHKGEAELLHPPLKPESRRFLESLRAMLELWLGGG